MQKAGALGIPSPSRDHRNTTMHTSMRHHAGTISISNSKLYDDVELRYLGRYRYDNSNDSSVMEMKAQSLLPGTTTIHGCIFESDLDVIQH
jgi:hypothetical protein